MDELKIRTRFMRGLISKLVAKMVYQKLGYKVDIQINDITVAITDGKANVHIDADGEIGIDEFKKVTKLIGLED